MTLLKNIDPEIFKRLYMVRHGESTCNTVNRIAGSLDAPLSRLGRAQANEAAKNKSAYSFNKVYSSPLSRAYDTAQIILERHQMDPSKIVIDARIMERDFGSYTLENKSRLQKMHGIAEYERAMNHSSETMQGGETFDEFSARVESFFVTEILPVLQCGNTVLVVSHKYVVELICKIILNRKNDDAYDLRLPNSEILCGDRIESYIAKEKKGLNIFYDWLVVNHALVFLGAALAGVGLNILGVQAEISPYLLLILLIMATTITMSRVEVESVRKLIFDKISILLVIVRYLFIPMVVFFAWQLSFQNGLPEDIALFSLLAAPSAAISMTVSRCVGGLVMPTLSYMMLSSVVAMVPLATILSASYQGSLLTLMTTTLGVSVGTCLVPYLIARKLRQLKPIWTAKFGERGGFVSVLCLAIFIALSSSRLDLDTFSVQGYLAVMAAVGLRIIAAVLAKFRKVSAIDDFIAMSYPNIFVMIILANLSGATFVEQVGLWFVVPMFLLSIFDSWYTRRLAVAPGDKQLFSLLEIKVPCKSISGMAIT